MSGETGSLRYMAPEVADALPYNWGADVYSFGIILWELNASKKPYEGLNRELFYERVVPRWREARTQQEMAAGVDSFDKRVLGCRHEESTTVQGRLSIDWT